MMNSALNVKLYFLFMKQQLKKTAEDVVVCILTFSIHHNIMMSSRFRWKKMLKFQTFIEQIIKQKRTNCWLLKAKIKFKIQHLYVIFSWWISLDIHIVLSADEVIWVHNINILCRDNKVLNIFTDSSIINNQIKTSAMISKLQQE